MQWILMLNAFIVILLIITQYYDLGQKSSSLEFDAFAIFLLILISLSFYKMETHVTQESLIIFYGIGWIKKTIPCDEIIKDDIEKVKLHWYYGMGIRLYRGGTIYNTKPGVGLKLRTKKRTYMIGTNQFEAFKKALLEQL